MAPFRVMMKVTLVMCAMAAGVVAASAQDRRIAIGVDGQFPPFNYFDADGNLQGFDIEIANALCAEMKAECRFVVQDWENIIPGLIEGKFDAIIASMSMSEERKEKVAFTRRYYDSPSVFVAFEDSALSSFDAAGLAGTRLGVALSTSQEAYARQFYGAASIVVFDGSAELYEGLSAGEVDVILEDKLAAYDWLTNTRAGGCCEFKGDDIKDPAFFGEGAGIAVRKQDNALRSDIQDALDVITGNGTYNMINAKYFPFGIR